MADIADAFGVHDAVYSSSRDRENYEDPLMPAQNITRVPAQPGEPPVGDINTTNMVFFMHLGIQNINITELRRRLAAYVPHESSPSIFKGLVVRLHTQYLGTCNVRIFDTGYCVIAETRSSIIALSFAHHLVNMLRRFGYPDARVIDFYVTNIIAMMKVPVSSIDVSRLPALNSRFIYSRRRFPGATCAADQDSTDPTKRISCVVYSSGYVVMAGACDPLDFIPVARMITKLALQCEGDVQSAHAAHRSTASTHEVLSSIDRMERKAVRAKRPAQAAPVALGMPPVAVVAIDNNSSNRRTTEPEPEPAAVSVLVSSSNNVAAGGALVSYIGSGGGPLTVPMVASSEMERRLKKAFKRPKHV